MTRLRIIAAVSTWLLLPGVVLAQQQMPAQHYEYAVKAICGRSDGSQVLMGHYMTAINLHNPSSDSLMYRYKVVVAEPRGEGKPSQFLTPRPLQYDWATEIDCMHIFRLAGERGFFKGFVVIQSTQKLDVVAVYTGGGEDRFVHTMDVEHVKARKTRGTCPDLTVEKIHRPEWDADNRRSVIRALIRNIGGATAPQTLARLIDPSTPQPLGAPYNDVQTTPSLAPGAAATVTFHLPYWVYNPDAQLEVTADYKNQLQECREDNNREVFFDIG